MKKINFVNKYEKKKVPAEKKFFYVILTICIAVVAVTGFIGTVNKSDVKKQPSNSKEVLKSSSENTLKPEYDEKNPSYDVIIPSEDSKKEQTEKQPKKEIEQPNPVNPEKEIVEITPEITVTEETNVPKPEEITSVPMPVEGTIMKMHSDKVPVFSKTMNDWRVHNGIDIACKIGDKVYASADGTIKEAYVDDKLGATIVIEHGGIETKYSNLASTDMAKNGGNVKKGDVIGVVGDTAKYEIADKAHLHFEIIKDGISINPESFLK